MVDVTDWYLVAEWDARPESSGAIAARVVATTRAVRRALPAFDGVWIVGDRTVDGADERTLRAIIDASPYRVDGVAEPARGCALSMLSELEEGVFLRVSITAGATFQTVVNPPNEVALDFVAGSFGVPIKIDRSQPELSRFEQLGAELRDVWAAAELRVAFQ